MTADHLREDTIPTIILEKHNDANIQLVKTR